VAQELVPAKLGSIEVPLAPLVPCSGVFRVTVFEERQGQLWPRAERLAYRPPEERLGLSVKTDKSSYAPGANGKRSIESVNEEGKPEPAWLLVWAVAQAVRGRSGHAESASLPVYFHFTSELSQPEDLEQADVLRGDTPEAAAALDLFLGTQGWRRFT